MESIFLLLSAALFSSALHTVNCDGRTVDVYPQNCSVQRSDEKPTLNSVLNGQVVSNTKYVLLAGDHCVSNLSYVEDMHNLTFSGNTSRPDLVNVTCAAGVGLAFINISSLTLEGMTVTACGLTGGNNQILQSELQNTTDFFYDIDPTDVIGIFVGLVLDFTVRSITVTETRGLGLLAVNLQRSSLIENSLFSHNHPQSCYKLPLDDTTRVNLTQNDQIGGGAYFIFLNFLNSNEDTNTSLKIHNTTFLKNSYCGLQAEIALDYRVWQIAEEVGYSLGGGGGLCIVLAQTTYSIQVEVQSSHFLNNTSVLGGGVHIAMFEGVSDNNISFYNCTFHKNGLAGNILANQEYTTSGSAVYVVKDLSFPEKEVRFILINLNASNTLLFKDCLLTANRAVSAGAVHIFSLYGSLVRDNVTFDNCTFSGNEAIVGAVMYVGERKQTGLQPGLTLVLRDVKITENRILFDSLENIALISNADSSAAIEIQSISMVLEGTNGLISDNYATAIRATSSVIYIEDHLVLSNNTGSFGGGMHLLASSYVVLKNNSHLRLENNTGAVLGGAFYVDLLAYSLDVNYHDCFLFFELVEKRCYGPNSCPSIEGLNFLLELIDNRSPLGSLMYGSTLDTCSWSTQLKQDFNKSSSDPVLEIMYELKDKFIFSSQPTTISAVTTAVSKLVIHDKQPLNITPGELFYLNVSSYDHLNHSTPTLLSSKPSTDNISSILGLSNFSFLDTGYGDLVPVIVTGGINLTNVTIFLYTTDSYTQTQFQVNLNQCVIGFEYIDGRCQCEPELRDIDIKCNATSMTLTVPNDRWVGPGPDGSLSSATCISDFCSVGEREVKPPHFDCLCHRDYNRSGILCGQCAEGYSNILGSHKCKECGNGGIALVILFAFAGVIIMFGILFLHIDVSNGYLNSILFYANVVSVYIPILNSSSRNATVFVLVAWLNQDYGIEQCFYDGMNELAHVSLRLVFPAYLILLMVLIIVFSKKSAMLSRFFSNAQISAGKLFATILLMSYSTILEVCLEVFGAVKLKSLDGETYVMWRSDPNQRYFHGLHIPLVILACALLFAVILPAPILLMFPAITFSTPLGVRIKPLLDAFWAPFKIKFRFFVGLRLLLRIIPNAIAYLLPQPLNILLLGVFSIALLFLQVVIQPFQGVSQNILDHFFILNIAMLVMGALYFEIFITAHQESQAEYVPYYQQQYAYSLVLVNVAYIAFLLVIMWHIQHRFPSICRTLSSLISTVRIYKANVSIDSAETTPIIGQVEMRSDSDSLSEEEDGKMTEATTHKTSASQNVPHVVNYSILREPLLEEGMADLVPVAS